MSTPDTARGADATAPADTMDQLIAACAAMPASLAALPLPVPRPREAARWSVDQESTERFRDLDLYV